MDKKVAENLAKKGQEAVDVMRDRQKAHDYLDAFMDMHGLRAAEVKALLALIEAMVAMLHRR